MIDQRSVPESLGEEEGLITPALGNCSVVLAAAWQ
jgi:hypothetical protein